VARPAGSATITGIVALIAGALLGIRPGDAPARAIPGAGEGAVLAAVTPGTPSGKAHGKKPQWLVHREAWVKGRADRRAARWTGTLDDLVRAQRTEAHLESLYLNTLALGSLEGAADRDVWRAAALDAYEDGRVPLAERILAGPLRSDPELVAIRARATLPRGEPDSGLALLGWPPERRRAPGAAPPKSLGHPALFVASTLADSAGDPAASRAALWTILESDPTPAARRTARLRLGQRLAFAGQPRLAIAVVTSEETESVEAALLAANARASVGDSVAALARLSGFSSTRGLPVADRYAAAVRAASWARGRLADSLDERVWLGLLRTLDYIGEPTSGLAVLQARRAAPRDSAAALERADVQASLLARARKHPEAAAAFSRLLARRDRPAADRARWALGLARARRSLGAFVPADSAFVAAATLDSAGVSGESAAWERAREWESRRPGQEAAPVFSWAAPRIKSATLLEAARIHEAANWMRAGQNDSAAAALAKLGGGSAIGRFWTARLALARGDSATAMSAFRDTWRLGPWTYEGLRSAEELRDRGLWPADSIPFRVRAPSRKILAPTLGADPPIVARLWNALGYVSLGREAMLDCARAEKGSGVGPCVASLEEYGWFRAVPSPKDSADLRMEYPPAYALEVFSAAEAESLDPAIVWAIMRQETGYIRTARSRAGALGLIQLLPRTASHLAGRTVSEESLLVAQLNVSLGAKYLKDHEREMGDPRAVFAAYNAGEDVVGRWIRDSGPVDDRWVELIPYRETRDYVKQVYAAWRRYEALYGTTAH
jgi:hypothetical protein